MTDFIVGRRRFLGAAFLAAVSIVTYANGLTGAFTYDDKAIVRDNPRIRSPRQVPRVFTTHYFGGPRGTGSLYRPVLLLSFALQWWIHGREVVAFHAVNLLLHIAATLLAARLILRLGLPPPIVAATALLFAVHPIHVEAVTSVVGRGETLSAVLVLLFLDLSLGFFEGRRRGPALGLALGCYALALLTKESASVAPGLAFLLFLFRVPGDWRARLGGALSRGFPLLVGCAAVLGGILGLRQWVFGGLLKSPATDFFEVENPLAHVSAAGRAANACLIFFRYLGRELFPLHLSADESAWSIRLFPARSVLPMTAAALLLLLCVAALARLPRRSPVALGFLFMALAFLPASNLLFPTGTIFAERLAYLPSLGLCMIAAALLMGRTETVEEVGTAKASALALLALLLAGRAVTRNSVWWTDMGLFSNSLSTSPSSAKAHYNYAYIGAHYRQYRTALVHYTRAVAIYDRYWDAWAGKGRMEKELGMLERAEKSYAKSIAANPGYENGYFGLGLVKEARGDLGGAAETYRRGIKENPGSLPLVFRLALAESKLGHDVAAKEWARAVELGPDSPPVRAGFAEWLLVGGRIDEARRQAREALRRDPSSVPALRVLAQADARQSRFFAEGLAREKIYRVTRDGKDRAELERIAAVDEAYRRRFEALVGSFNLPRH